MIIVVKVGTQAILAEDGTVQEAIIRQLVEQIVELFKQGHHVILVSSGAVGSGRRVARETLGREYGTSLGEKQVLASIGQHALMHMYADLLKSHGFLASQLLLTKQDFHTRQHYLNIARLLREILSHNNIIPIINENDSVAIEELMFTDNDELAGLIAAQINADKLILLTSVDGIYDGSPHDNQSKLIPVIDPQIHEWPTIANGKTTHGRGGMSSKLNIARNMSDLGITTHIANTNQPNVISRIISGEPIGTLIHPSKKKSNIKRWIAFNNGKQTGHIVVNAGLFDILKENKRIISLLPVGIEHIHGDFQKGDLVNILAPQGQKIGMGIARYSADKLREYLGQKDKPEFIHYNHLHIKIGS